jgi:hypothetical protein
MKHEWRKKEKNFYLPKSQPEVITIPPFKFITISGAGNPNNPHFANYITALYPIAYAIKMNLKKMATPPKGYQDYTVYPLEGIWDLNEKAKQNYDGTFNKDDLVFKLMLRQPAFVTADFYQEMVTLTKKKKPNPLYDDLKFETIEDGACIQMMHLGPYDDEPASFSRMEAFAAEKGLKRHSKVHREIYLTDFRKVAPEKLKTVLRFQLESL